MRAKNGTLHKNRRKRLMKKAQGYRGGRHRLYRFARIAVMKAGFHAFNDRRRKKRDMRALWIQRINAAVRERGLSYSRFMDLANKAGIQMNRKTLAELAFSDPRAFDVVVETARKAA